jgi:hypothetical protein
VLALLARCLAPSKEEADILSPLRALTDREFLTAPASARFVESRGGPQRNFTPTRARQNAAHLPTAFTTGIFKSPRATDTLNTLLSHSDVRRCVALAMRLFAAILPLLNSADEAKHA